MSDCINMLDKLCAITSEPCEMEGCPHYHKDLREDMMKALDSIYLQEKKIKSLESDIDDLNVIITEQRSRLEIAEKKASKVAGAERMLEIIQRGLERL